MALEAKALRQVIDFEYVCECACECEYEYPYEYEYEWDKWSFESFAYDLSWSSLRALSFCMKKNNC